MLVVSVGEKGCTEPGSNTQAVDIFAQEATKNSPNRAEVFTRPGWGIFRIYLCSKYIS